MTFTDLAIALGHEARERILGMLDDGSVLTMGELAEHLDLCPATTCHHVDVLERIGVVRRYRRGRGMLVEATCSIEIVVHRRSLGTAPETAPW